MIRKITLLLIIFLNLSNFGYAKELAVKIKPVVKITTSNVNLKEGDNVEFCTVEDVYLNSKTKISKGQKVVGIITSIDDNNYFVEPAKLYIENFKTFDSENRLVDLNGVIYKIGSDHHILTDFFLFDLLRGGEVQIKPNKDEFIIYTEGSL